jgi:hypothetical protein
MHDAQSGRSVMSAAMMATPCSDTSLPYSERAPIYVIFVAPRTREGLALLAGAAMCDGVSIRSPIWGWRHLLHARFALARYHSRPNRLRSTSLARATRQLCDLCERPIMEEDLEYELDLGGRTLHFHEKCLDMWRQVRG